MIFTFTIVNPIHMDLFDQQMCFFFLVVFWGVNSQYPHSLMKKFVQTQMTIMNYFLE